MSSLTANDNASKGSSDDLIQPFQLEETNFRGRIVRLKSVLDGILSAHDYPEPVARLLAEALVTTTLLAGMLKYEGIFTLQASGSGAVRSLVCDMTSEGGLRGYAGFDADAIAKLDTKKKYDLENLMGKGHLAFTVDQHMVDRYQGIVELQGGSILNSIQHYFDQSEQIKTIIRIATDLVDGVWCSGAIMLQKLPEDTRIQDVEKDDWERSKILTESCKDEELLDSDLVLNDLLFRLYHEEGIRVFTPQELTKTCRCSEERVLRVLSTLSEDDLDHSTEDGKVHMTCQFCSQEYSFDRDDIQSLEIGGDA